MIEPGPGKEDRLMTGSYIQLRVRGKPPGIRVPARTREADDTASAEQRNLFSSMARSWNITYSVTSCLNETRVLQ